VSQPDYSLLFTPLVEAADTRLCQGIQDKQELFSDQVRQDLKQYLAGHLQRIARPALDLRFRAFCSLRRPLGFGHSSDLSLEDPLYQEFIQQMSNTGLQEFLSEFPVLERLLQLSVNFWDTYIKEFYQHLLQDKQILQGTFNQGGKLGQMVTLRAGLSDPHHCQRTVLSLYFSSGTKLLYKPKDLGLASAWFSLLEWINQKSQGPPFLVLRVIKGPGYGWMEQVEDLPCRDEQEAKTCYYQAGRLLCLIYILQGSDFLEDNIVLHGKQPVFIDLETLLQPEVKVVGRPLSPTRFPGSVLRTHFLPDLEMDANGKPIFRGGLNKPHYLDRQEIRACDYAKQICTGFKDMYVFLTRHKQELVSDNGPVALFAGQIARPIYRDTRLYQRYLLSSLQPEYLREEKAREKRLQELCKLSVHQDLAARLETRLREEVSMLRQLDIPKFQMLTDTARLRLISEEAETELFIEPPWQSVVKRIQALGAQDCALQLELIRQSLDFQAQNHGVAFTRQNKLELGDRKYLVANKTPFARESTSEGSLDPDWYFSGLVFQLGEQIRQKAVHYQLNTVSWVLPGTDIRDKQVLGRLIPANAFLYNGSSGIALFLAALHKADESQKDYQELALAALKPVQDFLQYPCFFEHMPLGATEGLGSLVYALVRISTFLDQAEPLQMAAQLAELIPEQMIARDRKLDVFAGTAGLILGLLALYELDPDPKLKSKALACGGHLLSSRSRLSSGHRVWKTIQGKAISGFAHGQAGISYALLRLFRFSGDRKFFQAAKEAIEYEQSLFEPEKNNWLALGSSRESPVFWTSFCHGAPGIGLARLGGLPELGLEEVGWELEAALEKTLSYPGNGTDFLCCGSFGRIEFLFTAARRLQRDAWREKACQMARSIISQRLDKGAFNLLPELKKDTFHPGFFQGAAGIGYASLRLAYPGEFPCVLLWE
jgi:lantibiotic modifying enzyme